MKNLTFITAKSRKSWDEFVGKRAEANFLQSWDFYEFHAARGKKVVRRLVFDDKRRVVAAYAGVVETAKRGRYMAVAGGPILDYKDPDLLRAVVNDLRYEGEKLGCIFVRIRPQEPETDDALQKMADMGLRKAPYYLSAEYVGILDLHKNEEEILAGASQGLRRKVRKAQKNGIEITKTTDPKIIDEFYKIQLETAKRQKFVAFSKEYLKKQYEAFSKNGEVVMYIAKKDDEVLAENFIVFYGPEASYHYGVSSELGTKYSAAPLLHLSAMEDARKRGIYRYNFWGIVGLEEKEHRFYGVSEFKRSFGVTELKYLPAHDLVLKKVPYLKDFAIEKIRRKVRHV